MAKPVIWVLEEDAAFRRRLRELLRAEGVAVLDSPEQNPMRGSLPSLVPDLVIVGSLPQGATASLDAAQRIRRWKSDIPIILVTPQSSEQLAIAALRTGISDYFAHPVPFEELTASIRRCLEVTVATTSSRGHGASHSGRRMIGDCARMQEIQAYLGQVAATESTVLITGETGTGKELTAEFIHSSSRRRQKPFVHINCAAIPDTLLESELFGYERGAFTGAHGSSAGKLKLADGGTVLFDEVGDMNIYAQAKILRLIESKEIERLGGRRSIAVDVRVIAATNQDLERLMAEGRFRKDLYYRLNVSRVHLPALRERKEDLPALLDHYTREFGRVLGRPVDGFTDEAFAALLSHDWPGNVRELRNVVEAAFTTLCSRRISLADLPAPYRVLNGDSRQALPHGERDRLLAALSATKWNKSKAAAQLHWSRMTVYRKITKYCLVEDGYVAAGHSSDGGTAAGRLSNPP